MSKVSIKAAVRDALREEKLKLKATAAATGDSFTNFTMKLGIGADNALSGSSYGFNPITRNRQLLEWIHRGSWLGGVAVDTVADDMTRAGVEFVTTLRPEVSEVLHSTATRLNIWESTNEVIRWSRLYGGCIGVALIDGQDMRTPLNVDTVGPGQFKGTLVLDRWMVEPTLEDLVDEMGPNLGLPRYYRVQANAPALRGSAVHYSRVMFRLEGIQLPYQQRLTENLWGLSVLERLYDRMIAFDSASTGAAQLVYKSYLRTLKMEGLRDTIAGGGKPLEGLLTYVDTMRRYQGMEGITLLDAKDEFEVQGHSAFSGLADALTQFGQQLSGALQIPLVRLFGQSPAGLNSTGESDLRMYYDHIKQQQQKTMYRGMVTIFKLIAKSKGIILPPNFEVEFKSLWQLSDEEKGNIAKTNEETVSAAKEAGLISDQTALKELRQASRVTGVFTNITDEDINKANADVDPPDAEGMIDPETGLPIEGPPGMPGLPGAPKPGEAKPPIPGKPAPGKPVAKPEGAKPNEVRPQGKAGPVPDGPRRRVQLQQPPAGRSKAD